MKEVDILIIGGGSAGIAAALAACEKGVHSIFIAERSPYLGGILRQCIHNGFGIHHFGEDLTGVEYADRCVAELEKAGISYGLHTFILRIGNDLTATAVSPEEGLYQIRAKAIVLAMGCRERARGALLIPGWRSAGVLTAGCAQRYMNMEGYMPGERIVILGSGDIGLIMARQFVTEGARVECVVEIMPYSGGLARNLKQCLEDFDIPIHYGTTVTEIHGRSRVEGVTIARVDEKRKPIPGTERKIACDTLVISAGLIPENELSEEAGVVLSQQTGGAEVDEHLQTSVPGMFACGNVLHVHDLVDFVSAEGAAAGTSAADYVQGSLPASAHADCIRVESAEGVTAVVPQYIRRGAEEKVRLFFRSRAIFKNCTVVVETDGKDAFRFKRRVAAPGEMQECTLPAGAMRGVRERIAVRICEKEAAE